MAFTFHAGFVDCDEPCRRLSFADRNDDELGHYFIFDRAEEGREQSLPDAENLYLERDDQQWGGYGGVERVILNRSSLTLQLSTRMAKIMGEHDEVVLTFEIGDSQFSELRNVLGAILHGYEDRLEIRDRLA